MGDFKKKLSGRYRVTALDQSVSKMLLDQMQGINKNDHEQLQTLLDSFVASEGIVGDDLADLMYDLSKAGYHALKKPGSSSSDSQGPLPTSGNPLIAAVKAGKITKALGDAIDNADETQLNELKDFFKKNPAIYGKFISEAEKNAIGVYEKDIALPITKEVLQHVTDAYLLDSILFSSVYGTKKIDKAAVEYAFQKFQNPLQAYKDHYKGDWAAEQLMSQAYGHGFDDKVTKWFKALDPTAQKYIRDNWTGNDADLPA